MIFEIYSKVLTNHGFKNIKDVIDKTNFELAYVTKEGRLAFTKDFKVTKERPDYFYTYTNNLYISTATSSEAKYYSHDLSNPQPFSDIKKDEQNLMKIVSCYDTFKGEDLSCNDILLDIRGKEDKKISYISFLKILILYMSYSAHNHKEEAAHDVRLYSKNKTDLAILTKSLETILGRENFSIYFGSNNNQTIYINSSKLYYIVHNIEEILDKILADSCLSRLFCIALKDLSEDLHFFDEEFKEFYVFFGRTLNKYIDYIAAFLVVNGYKIYFRRMPDRRYKLMFTDRSITSGCCGSLKEDYNKAHFSYYNIHAKEQLPIFVLETRDWLSNVSLRATLNNYEEIRIKELEELRKKEELNKSLSNTSVDPFDLSDVFNIGR